MSSPLNEHMRAVLRERVVPAVREMGFKGTFPHFYRRREDQLDLLMFQFAMSGWAFAVEMSLADDARTLVLTAFRELPDSKLRCLHINPYHRYRLGNGLHSRGGLWFVFDFKTYDPPNPRLEIRGTPEDLAEKVIRLLGSEAETRWRTRSSSDEDRQPL